MSNTINDLHDEYVSAVADMQENDRYFQYLFEMISAGENIIENKRQVLHKVVDERWIKTIEDSLDAINKIIEKPRRFITTKEEVVPVALARKITADSVRHLSRNTQFIANSEDGNIQPTRILNVSTEETYDLYENRFIYHLIQRLVTFIDKRTDVIFWSTADETKDVLSIRSKIDDAYEQIEYKIDLTIKNNQSFVENDSDNMDVFMRIDRLRRLVMALRQSSFCSIMHGCAKVRSPIQRTNLLMKDPDYRTCYKLWQFLESYDEVGYTIDVQNSTIEFDEEYQIEMFTNLITNYTVFKSLLEPDKRDIASTVLQKKHKALTPKFIKQIREEMVESRDIPDVEIRKVFVEEVTQAQLDAEARAEEEHALRIKAEEACEDAEIRAGIAEGRAAGAEMEAAGAAEKAAKAEELLHQKEDEFSAELEKIIRDKAAAIAAVQAEKLAAVEKAETERNIAVAQAEKERDIAVAQAETEKKNAIESVNQEKAEAIEKINSEKTEAIEKAESEKRAAIEKADQEKAEAIEKADREKNDAIAEALAEKADAIAAAMAERDASIAAAKADKTAAIAAAQAEKLAAVEKAETERDIAVAQAETEKKNAIDRANQEKVEAIEKINSEKRAAIEKAESEKQAAIAAILAEKEAEIAKLIEEKNREAALLKASAAENENRLKAAAEETENRLKAAAEDAERRFRDEETARIRAERRAEANTLGKVIANTFGFFRPEAASHDSDKDTADAASGKTSENDHEQDG